MCRYGDESGEEKGHIRRIATCPLRGYFTLMVSWPHNHQYQNIFLISKKVGKRAQIVRIKRLLILIFINRLEMTEFELPVSMNHIYGDWIC